MAKRRSGIADIALPLTGLAVLWGIAHPDGIRAISRIAFVLLLVVISMVALAAIVRFSLRGNDTSRSRPAHKERIPPRLGPDESEKPLLAVLPWGRPESQRPPPPPQWSVRLIESLEWKRFEDLCAGYFKAKGHKITMTGLGADGGVDFYLHGAADPSKPLAVAQCKAWTKSQVGVKSIRELLGVMTDVGAPLGIFLTTTSYTEDARRFAAGKHIKLLDAHRLLELIKALPEGAQADLLARVTEGDYTTPSCPSCGSKLVLRTATKGAGKGRRFWGCKNFPRGCRYSMPARSAAMGRRA
jgi:restriction system protein